MPRNLLNYARGQSAYERHLASGSVARWGLRLAVGVALGQATLLTLAMNADDAGQLVDFAAGILAIVTLILWVIGIALSLAAWIDRDGARRTAAMAVVLLAAEALLVVLPILAK